MWFVFLENVSGLLQLQEKLYGKRKGAIHKGCRDLTFCPNSDTGALDTEYGYDIGG